MAKQIDWRVWKTKEDNPFSDRFILVRSFKYNDILYAYYAGGAEYMIITAKRQFETLSSYVLKSGFNEGDEWIYADDLKKEET